MTSKISYIQNFMLRGLHPVTAETSCYETVYEIAQGTPPLVANTKFRILNLS